MTFSASGAIEKEKAFIVTAEYRESYGPDEDGREVELWSCGFGGAYDNENIKIGDITPQEIDGFKIIEVMDYGYIYPSEYSSGLSLWANRKCILHIKGKDYRLTHRSGSDFYDDTDSDDEIGIKDKEQIKVTYTLL